MYNLFIFECITELGIIIIIIITILIRVDSMKYIT